MNRVQRIYFKKLPAETKVVTRPTKYGNPFIVGKPVPDVFFEMYNFKKYSDCPSYLDNGDELHYIQRGHEIETVEEAVRLHNQYLNWLKHKYFDQYSKLIQGFNGFKNVACFCKVDAPCHADNWIEHFNNYLPFK